MKAIKLAVVTAKKILYAFLILSPALVFSQQSIECEIMRKNIMDQINAPDRCQSINQQCLANARGEPFAKSECGIGYGSCQLGGAIGNEMGAQRQLQENIQRYKNMCER